MNVARTLLMMLLLVVLVNSTKADEVSEVKQQVQELQKRIEQLEAEKQSASILDSLKGVENVKLFGDLRYRNEYVDDQSKADTRDRDRIRARFDIKGKVNDEVDLTIGLASGSSESATGTNQTLTDGFSSKAIWLDLAYFD